VKKKSRRQWGVNCLKLTWWGAWRQNFSWSIGWPVPAAGDDQRCIGSQQRKRILGAAPAIVRQGANESFQPGTADDLRRLLDMKDLEPVPIKLMAGSALAAAFILVLVYGFDWSLL
jgi:hypothetical protein